MLIEQLSTDFDPTKYEDEYRKRILDSIGKKVVGEEITVTPEAPRANVIDLMAALQASLDQVAEKKEEPKKKTTRTKKRQEPASG
jgi:DNA end-binding protein Ku